MSVYTPYANKNQIDVPIYGGMCTFYAQASTEPGHHIEVTYEAISVLAMGLDKTDVALTMLEHSNNSIFSQAGASVLTQANQQQNYILQLLQ